MTSLEQAAGIIVNECLCIKEGEKVFIITDKNLKNIGDVLLDSAKKIAETKIIEIPVGKVHGEEPGAAVAEEMKRYDVVIIPTTRSLTHTKARMDASKAGARIASMPGITEEMMKRAINVDYAKMAKITNKLKDVLDKGKKAMVVTDAGTDITFSIDGRKAYGSAGFLREKCICGNLPAGETYIAPVEGTADGKFVIDGSVLNKRVKSPITVVVEDGYAVEINGKTEADGLRRTLEGINNKDAFNIAEFGIGTNEKAVISGNVLEDEKVLGTCHIAFGNNKGFGGRIDVPIHIDGVLLKPTIYIDDKMIMRECELLL